MDRHSDVVQNENGRAVPGASIQILDQNGSLATIYADRQGAALANPLTTDGLGRWSFCAADGVYSAKVYLAGVLKATLPDIRLEDPSDGLAALSAPTGATLIGTSAGTVQGEITTLKSVVAGLHNYTLPVASSATLGGVKVGSGLAIDGAGVVSLTYSYTLPTASGAVIGGVRVGSGLAIDGAGILSATYSYALPLASASILGGVKVGSGLAIDGTGTLSATGVTSGSVATVNSVTPTSGNVVLTTDNLPESGTPTNQWFTAARVRSVVLTGLTTATNAAAAATDTLLAAIGKLQAQISANSSAITTNTTAIATKDATGGYAGLTGFAINLKNAAGTIVSSIAGIATVARTYTFPDKDITVAGTTNETLVKPTIKGYIELLQALNPGATVTIDPLQGTLIELTTTVTSTTITLPAAVAGASFTLMVKWGATGHTITFAGGTSLRWANNNVIPTATSTLNRIDAYVFTCGTGYTVGRDGWRNA